MDAEFDNFLEKVTEVEDIVKQMGCQDKRVAESASRRADLLLRGQDDPRPGALHCRTDRTVINHKALASMGKSDDPAEMSKEVFMAQLEKDAEKRAKDRRERKERSNELKLKANKAFRVREFEKAFDLYNKAIEETRDSAVLYENRALTCFHLELHSKTVDDCNWALRLNENSLKALLYKARATHLLGDQEKSDDCIAEAMTRHPHHENLIKEFSELWIKTHHKNQDHGKVITF